MRAWKSWIALLAGGLGLRALLRRRTRAALPGSPADELKATLAAAKGKEQAPAPAAAPEAEREAEPEAEPAAEPEGIDERRADVHARARRAIDELRENPPA